VEIRIIFGGLDNVRGESKQGCLLTYEMCSIRKGEKRDDFVNLLVVKYASNRKLYARANLRVLS